MSLPPFKDEVPNSLKEDLEAAKKLAASNEASESKNKELLSNYYRSRVDSLQAAIDAHASVHEGLMKEYRHQVKETRKKSRNIDLNDVTALRDRIRRANAFLNANTYVNRFERLTK